MTEPQIHFHPAADEKAQAAFKALSARYGQVSAEQADIIVPLGGDGTMLDCLHKLHDLNKPFYGMNLGTVGFLLNPYNPDDLPAKLAAAQNVNLFPLRMTATCLDGSQTEALAFNEVALFRETRHAAKIKIHVNGNAPMDETLVCDGVMLATPGGSTAYNLSAGGPIIPLGSNVLALTPVSPFRPRRWRGALLPADARVHFEVVEPAVRPVRAETDFTSVHQITSVDVHQSRSLHVTLLFNPDHNLEERVLKEQFLP